MPPTVSGYYLIVLLGRHGLIGESVYNLTGWTVAFTWQAAVIAAGGGTVGKIAVTEVDGVGVLRVVYARDPEGNIVELQKWS